MATLFIKTFWTPAIYLHYRKVGMCADPTVVGHLLKDKICCLFSFHGGTIIQSYRARRHKNV